MAQRLPTSPARDLLRVIREAIALGNSLAVVLNLVEHYPIPSFGNKTALGLIEAGRADDVIAYLQSLSGGWVG